MMSSYGRVQKNIWRIKWNLKKLSLKNSLDKSAVITEQEYRDMQAIKYSNTFKKVFLFGQ